MEKILIDTHILLWILTDSNRLTPQHKKRLQESNEIYVSIISFWEISLKISGKGFNDIQLPSDWITVFVDTLNKIQIKILNISLEDCKKIETLPPHHKDPFDRMIIAQASTKKLAVMTSDKAFKEYDIELL